MHYVVGDVHGCFNELNKLINKIEEQDDKATFIFVGDLIDRGPLVWQTLQWFMENITDNGKYQCVRGNHEQMIIDWYYKEYLYWVNKDFRIIPKTKYDFTDILIENNCTKKCDVENIVKFFESLPYRKELLVNTNNMEVKYSIVHAGDSFDTDITEKDREFINIHLRDNGYHNTNTIVIHGHTPTITSFYKNDRPGMIGYKENDVCVDGGCCFGGMYNEYPTMLCAICLENLQEYYSEDSIEERLQLNNPNLNSEEINMMSTKYKSEYFINMNPYKYKLYKRLGFI